MRIPACGRAECFPAIAPEHHLHRVADSASCDRHRQQKTAASAWAYNAAPMRASVSIRAIIVARGPTNNLIATNCGFPRTRCVHV